MISVTHHTIGDVCISDTCSMLMAMACDMATECLQGKQHDPQGAERNLVPILSRLGQRHGKKNMVVLSPVFVSSSPYSAYILMRTSWAVAQIHFKIKIN